MKNNYFAITIGVIFLIGISAYLIKRMNKEEKDLEERYYLILTRFFNAPETAKKVIKDRKKIFSKSEFEDFLLNINRKFFIEENKSSISSEEYTKLITPILKNLTFYVKKIKEYYKS